MKSNKINKKRSSWSSPIAGHLIESEWTQEGEPWGAISEQYK